MRQCAERSAPDIRASPRLEQAVCARSYSLYTTPHMHFTNEHRVFTTVTIDTTSHSCFIRRGPRVHKSLRAAIIRRDGPSLAPFLRIHAR